MKFENAAIVMTDTDTGKPYARQLSAWELNLVLSQLQALDGGALKAREIAPFVMRTTGISQAEAERIAEKQAGLHRVARHGVQAFVDMAKADTALPSITDQLIGKRVTVALGMPGRQAGGKGSRLPPAPTGPNPIDQRINEKLPRSLVAATCDHEWIPSEGRTASGVLCKKCGDYDGTATECQHKAHYHGRCQVCGHKVKP